jgi:TetR/AcrR family transcriptional regulator
MRNGLPVHKSKTTKKVPAVKGGKAVARSPAAAKKPSKSVDGPANLSRTRQRILNVATREFSAKGYDGARVDDIMRLSKVSKNLIYHYFGSKEKLFIAVLESA